MSKATLLAVSLLGISAVVVLRAAGHEPASPQSVSESNDAVIVNSTAKADRLPVAVSANAAKVVEIEPQAAKAAKVVEMEPQPAASADQKKSMPAKAEVTSWHWNARTNKVTRR